MANLTPTGDMAEASTLRPVARRNKRGRGFTYLSLIILVAIIGLVAASAIRLGGVLQRSRAEQELLEIGAAFSDALKSYADATPQGMPPQPPSLKELLKDPRFPGIRRHLRKIFVDPMTGKAEWGIDYLGEKSGVVAVYSLSQARPVKISNFPLRYSGFEGKSRLSEWKFSAEKQALILPLVANPQQSAQQPEKAAPLVPDGGDKAVPSLIERPLSPSEQVPPVEGDKPAAEQQDL